MRLRTPVVRAFPQRIAAPPDAVFPLICPVREGEWLDGWADGFELIASRSGLAEQGCVFRTRAEGLPETIWVITRHDPAAHVVEFVRVTAGLVATTLTVAISAVPDDPGASHVDVRYVLTPTSDDGERLVSDRFGEAAVRDAVAWWERSLNHFLATGDCLRREGAPAPHRADGSG